MSIYDLIINEGFQKQINQKDVLSFCQQKFIKVLFQYPSQQLGQAAQEFAETIPEFCEMEEIFLEVNPYCLIQEQVYLDIANRCSQNMKNLKRISLIFGDYCNLGNLSFIINLRALLLNEFILRIGKINNLNHFSYLNLKEFLFHQRDLLKLEIQIGEENQFVDESLQQLSQALFELKHLIEFSFNFNFSMTTQKGVQAFSEALKTLVYLKKFNFYNSEKYFMIEGFSLILDSLGYMKDLIDLHIIFMFEKIIYPEDAQIMVKSFANLSQLKYLELRGFNIFQQQSNDQIADIIINKIYLETLIIFFNKVPEDSQIYNRISKYLQHMPNLKDLQIQISNINSLQLDGGFDFFSNSLIKLQNLECLNLQILSGGQIDFLQFTALGNALKSLIKLKQLDLFIGEINGVNKEYLLNLFEGVSKLVSLTSLKIKIRTLKQKRVKFEIIGNALKHLSKLQNLSIEIETQSISYKQISDLGEGLKQLNELIELRINLKSFDSLSIQEEVFRSIKDLSKIEILEIYHKPIKFSHKQYDIPKQFNICTALNLKELQIQLDVTIIFNFGNQLKQFFESAQHLVVADLEIIYNMVTQYGARFQTFLGYLKLPSSIQDLRLIFLLNKQIQSEQLALFQIFQNLQNLKALKLEFQIKITKGIIFDLDKCLSYCKELLSLSLKLGFSLYQREGQSLISMIKQLTNLRELELNLPHFTQFEKQFVLQFKETLSNLKNLYSYNQNVKFLQRKGINQYDHIQNLHNLVECQLLQNQDSIQKKIQINHRVSQKFRHNYQNVDIDNTKNKSNYNLTTLSIQFDPYMSIFCYLEVLKSLKNFINLKELSLNFQGNVYLTKTEVKEFRIGLSQLSLLQKLSLNFQNCIYSILVKKIIYALGKGLQAIENVENLKLDIAKTEKYSYCNYFQQLFKGIVNQKKLQVLHLMLVGCHQSEFQNIDFEKLLENQNKLQNLKLSIDGYFDEQNQINLGKGICQLQKLRHLFIKINSKLEISLNAEELIIQGIQNMSNLEQLIIDVNTKKTNWHRSQSNKKAFQILNNKKCLSECAIQFGNQINLEIKQHDIQQIDDIKNFRFNMILNQEDEKQDNQYEFMIEFVKILKNVNKLKIEMSYLNNFGEQYILDLTEEVENKLDFGFKIVLLKEIKQDIFSFLQALVQIVKISLKIDLNFFSKQIILEQNFRYLNNIQVLSVAFQNSSKNEQQILLDFSKGLIHLQKLKKLALIYFQSDHSKQNLDELTQSLSQLKYLSYLNLQFYWRSRPSIQYLINNINSFSKLSKLNQIVIKHSDYNSLDLRKIQWKNLKRKYLRLVSFYINQVSFPYDLQKKDKVVNQTYQEL
ncbi:hypothetical protein ABPG74_010224 [Tetrahymena malaccensis]